MNPKGTAQVALAYEDANRAQRRRFFGEARWHWEYNRGKKWKMYGKSIIRAARRMQRASAQV